MKMARSSKKPAAAPAIEAQDAPQAPAVALAPAPSLESLLAAMAERALSPDERAQVQALIAAKGAKRAGGGGKPAELPPAFGSIGPDEAAALKPRLRAAYLAQGSGYSLDFTAPGAEGIEGAAVALARKLGSTVYIRSEGRDVMAIRPDHGQGDALPRAMREGEKPTDQQAILIAQCSRPEGATGGDLMKATGSDTPHSWPPALKSCERFGYRFWKSLNPQGKAVYFLSPLREGEGEEAPANDAGEGEGEGEMMMAAE